MTFFQGKCVNVENSLEVVQAFSTKRIGLRMHFLNQVVTHQSLTSFHVINHVRKGTSVLVLCFLNSAILKPKMCPSFLDSKRDIEFVLIELDARLC